jgi:hypothetical protein
MISQLMLHKGDLGEGQDHDPALIVLTPIEQYLEEVTFSTPNNVNIYHQYKAHCFIAITDSVGIHNL